MIGFHDQRNKMQFNVDAVISYLASKQRLCSCVCGHPWTVWRILTILGRVTLLGMVTVLGMVTILLMVDILVYWSHQYQFAISYNTVRYRQRRWVTILGRWVTIQGRWVIQIGQNLAGSLFVPLDVVLLYHATTGNIAYFFEHMNEHNERTNKAIY